MWISWISSSFKGEIRVRVCRGVFSKYNDYQISERDRFYSKNRSIKVWSSSESCHETKKITEDPRKKSWWHHQDRKGYKTISKEFGLHKSTVTQIVYKWRKFKTTVTIPRSGRQTKISKVPRVSSKKLQAFLTLAKVKVHEPIIRRTLSNHGVHGRAARRKPLFSKKKIVCLHGQARGLLEKG